MSCKSTSIGEDETLKILNSCPRALLCLWVTKQPSNQHFFVSNKSTLIISGKFTVLLHAANTTSSNTSRHHFKDGELTICELPWQSVHRETYLTQSVLAVLPYFLQRHHFLFLLCVCVWRVGGWACHTLAIILSQHIHHPSYLHDQNYWCSYYITTGQWFMSCWSRRADGW